MTKNILVLGGGGYVGSVLVPKLIFYGYKVVVYDLFLYGNYLKSHSNLKIIQGDIRNINKIKTSLTNIDTVIHLACISNDPSFELNPLLSKSINYDCFEPFVDLSIKAGVNKFIFASSSSVYGIKKEKNVKETSKLEPLTDYSKYKVECEKILISKKTTNFHPTILRPSTVNGYSPRQRLDVVVNIMTNLAFHKKKITVFGGNQLRPNIYIEDMVRAYLCILKSPIELISGEIFNVGDENLSVSDIALKVKDIIHENINIEVTKTDDNRSYHVSSKKINSILNFDLKYNVSHGIDSLITAFKKRLLTQTFDNDDYYNIKVLKKIDLK